MPGTTVRVSLFRPRLSPSSFTLCTGQGAEQFSVEACFIARRVSLRLPMFLGSLGQRMSLRTKFELSAVRPVTDTEANRALYSYNFSRFGSDTTPVS